MKVSGVKSILLIVVFAGFLGYYASAAEAAFSAELERLYDSAGNRNLSVEELDRLIYGTGE